MKHHEWLIRQLDALKREGVLADDAAERVRAWALEKRSSEESGGSKLAQVVVGGLGALMVGAGLLAIIAHNWDMIPRGMRLAGAFAVMALAQGFLGWTLKRGELATAWVKEVAAMLVMLTSGGCLALVSQIYNLGGDWPDFLLAWVVLNVPVIWASLSHGVVLFHLTATAIWALAQGFESSISGRAWYYLPLFASLLPYWPGLRLARRDLPTGMRWAVTLSALAGLMAVSMDAANHDANITQVWWLSGLVATVLLLFPLSHEAAHEGLTRKPQVLVGGWMLFGLAFAHSNTARLLGRVTESLGAASALPWFWVLAAVTVVFAVLALRAQRWGVLAIASLVLTPLLVVLTGGDSDVLSWMFTGHLFLIGVALIGAEFVGRPGAPRLGAMIIALLILMRMADSELPLLLKSVLFMIIGIGFIAFNIVWSKRRRALKQKEATS